MTGKLLDTDMRQGITIAGSFVVDIVKSIDVYPKIGELANLQEITRAIGGCVPNTATDLAVIDADLKVSAVGTIGNDENGEFLLENLRAKNIETDQIQIVDKMPTSFCDVMSVPSGERTFFSHRGANAVFSPADVRIDELNCRIFHLGYLLLLNKFDEEDKEFGTAAARFLRDVQLRGIKTSIDVVSSSDMEEFQRKIKPVLRYVDYVIVNELECCNIWGLACRKENGEIDVKNIRNAMQRCLDYGVREKVIVHAKEGAFCMNKNGSFTSMGSLIIPKNLIKGSVGAGDAFCAGSLYAIYNDYSDKEILEFASGAAACSLFEANAVDGMREKKEIEKIITRFERRVN
ncbi:MAG: carbohydrate kinase family protein [Clostridia bacterium]|nr:carbohydrate kinase family protein [Clostridia bacterium]